MNCQSGGVAVMSGAHYQAPGLLHGNTPENEHRRVERLQGIGLMSTPTRDKSIMDKKELGKVEQYLRQTFANHAIRVVGRPRKNDSAEVYLGDEFIGVLFVDDEDGDKSYSFQMAILDTDLDAFS